VTIVSISPTCSAQVAKQLSMRHSGSSRDVVSGLPVVEASLRGRSGLPGLALDRLACGTGRDNHLGDIGKCHRRIGEDEHRADMRVDPLCQQESCVENRFALQPFGKRHGSYESPLSLSVLRMRRGLRSRRAILELIA
jgi:hypothetical protein